MSDSEPLIVIIPGIVVVVFIASLLCRNFENKITQYSGSKLIKIFLYPLCFPALCLLLYYVNQTLLTRMVMFVDSLFKPSTYTPFLGDLGKIIDFADQNGWIPEIGTSPEVTEIALTIASSNRFIGLGFLIIVILISIGFYRTFHFKEYSMRSIFFFHLAASVVLIITSIIFTSKAIKIDDDAIWYVFLIMYVVIALLFMKQYYNELKQLK